MSTSGGNCSTTLHKWYQAGYSLGRIHGVSSRTSASNSASMFELAVHGRFTRRGGRWDDGNWLASLLLLGDG